MKWQYYFPIYKDGGKCKRALVCFTESLAGDQWDRGAYTWIKAATKKIPVFC